MITQWIFDAIEAVASWVVGLIPNWTPPSWVTDNSIVDGLTSLGHKAAPMAHWVPFDLLATVVVALVALRGALLVFDIVLKVYAMIRGGAS